MPERKFHADTILMVMNVLVTGGAGFIGSHVVEALLQRNYCVAILDNFDSFYPPACKRRNLEEVRTAGKISLIEGDICEPAEVYEAFTSFKPELVVHLAAQAGV